MPNYQKWEYRGDIAALNDQEFLNQLWKKLKEVENYNETLFRQATQKDQEIGKMIAEIYGDRSAAHNYWKRLRVPKPSKFNRQWSKLMRELLDWNSKEKRRVYRRDYRRRQNEVIAELEANGYELDKHFTRNESFRFKREVLVEIAPGVFGNRALPEPGQTHYQE